jgi:hypothetical protein
MENTKVDKISFSVVSDQVSLNSIPPREFTGYHRNTANLSMSVDLPYNQAEILRQMVRTGLHLKITIEYF